MPAYKLFAWVPKATVSPGLLISCQEYEKLRYGFCTKSEAPKEVKHGTLNGVTTSMS